MVSLLDRNNSECLNYNSSVSNFKSLASAEEKNEEWRKSIRETVEKAITSKVEQRLDTPPLERMRRRQREARTKKEQQLRDLEQNMILSQSANAGLIGDSWKRKFANLDNGITDSEFLKKLDRMKNPRGVSAIPVSDQPSSSCSSSADVNVLSYNSPSANESKLANNTVPSDWIDSSDNSDNIFSTTAYETKRMLFRKFCKEGFKEAVRNGSIQSTDCKGVFADEIGMELSYDGPFWPSGYGPLVKTPNHIIDVPKNPELLSFALGENNNGADSSSQSGPCNTSNRTVSNSSVNNERARYVQYPLWESPLLVYDSSRFVTSPVPHEVPENSLPSLVFESRFECGNLALAFRVGELDYELVLRADLFTDRHTQWFYFRVGGMVPGVSYCFKIINLSKPDSLYNCGMRPLMYSEITAIGKSIGWHRIGHHVTYSPKTEVKCAKYCKTGVPLSSSAELEFQFAVLSWQVEFTHKGDMCYFAHCYPYTFTRLRNFIGLLCEKNGAKKCLKKETLCETRAKNTCYLLTITNQDVADRDKRGVVVSARVHPGESNSSWMMEGFLEFITSDNHVAQMLRDKFIFKVVPMLNPDGVIVGNYRCSLFGKDLNRNYRKPKKDYFPTIWATKSMMDRLAQRCEVTLYIDMHGHSTRQNVFMYGCDSMYRDESINNYNGSGNNGTSGAFQCGLAANGAGSAGGNQSSSFNEGFLSERLFPFLMSLKASDKFSFKYCKFNIKKSKESTGRVVVFRQYNIPNAYTMEATFCGTTLSGANRHFNSNDFKAIGKTLTEALLDYSRALEDEHAESRYILELTRAVTRQFILDLPKKTAAGDQANNSRADDSTSEKELAKRKQKLEEISGQLSKSRSLKECFKLLDSMKSQNQDSSHDSDTDDSDSGSEKEFLGTEKKKIKDGARKRGKGSWSHGNMPNGVRFTRQKELLASSPLTEEWTKVAANSKKKSVSLSPSIKEEHVKDIDTNEEKTKSLRRLQSAKDLRALTFYSRTKGPPKALQTSLLQWRKSKFDFDAGVSLRQCNQNSVCWEQELSMAVSRLLDSTFYAQRPTRPFTVASEMVKKRHLNAKLSEFNESGNSNGGGVQLSAPALTSSMGARASAVVNELSYTLFNNHKPPINGSSSSSSNPSQLMVPAKMGIKCMGSGSANSAVSRSAALNPYGTRTSKGFPLFTEERLREKQLKQEYILKTLQERHDTLARNNMVIPASSNLFDSPTVWGTKIESKTGGLYPRNEKQQPSKLMRNGKGATQEPHGKASAIASSVITAALPTSVVHRNEGVPIISKTQSASSNMRPKYVVTEKTVERVGTAGSSNLSSSVATNSPLSFKLQNNPDLDQATSSAKQIGTHKSRAVPRNQPTARRGDSNSGDAAGPDWKHRTGEHDTWEKSSPMSSRRQKESNLGSESKTAISTMSNCGKSNISSKPSSTKRSQDMHRHSQSPSSKKSGAQSDKSSSAQGLLSRENSRNKRTVDSKVKTKSRSSKSK
ncbi:uncharacterized protein LOC134848357 isoform X2 [Symsagittifera roscoffensis]|uniref:uncharacterized protein LOC134848357 isoform X2 n=1 Tax=Symsagittifera roscoffensis TaxID=84072 RepID=UPI00307B3E5A